jgi:hypothetical protein
MVGGACHRLRTFMGGMGGYFRECLGEVSTIAFCCLQWTATVRQGPAAIDDLYTGNAIHRSWGGGRRRRSCFRDQCGRNMGGLSAKNVGQMWDKMPFTQTLQKPTLYRLVPGAGIEPAWPCDRGILSPLCLPIPPPRRLKRSESYTAISKSHPTYPYTEVEEASFQDRGRNFYHNWHR